MQTNILKLILDQGLKCVAESYTYCATTCRAHVRYEISPPIYRPALCDYNYYGRNYFCVIPFWLRIVCPHYNSGRLNNPKSAAAAVCIYIYIYTFMRDNDHAQSSTTERFTTMCIHVPVSQFILSPVYFIRGIK